MLNRSVVKVEVLLTQLDQNNAHSGFMGFLDWAGESLNPHHHRKDRFQSWLTHFAIVASSDDGKHFLIQRSDHEVSMLEITCGSDELKCYTATMEWEGQVNMGDAVAFVEEQKHHSYDLVSKNCQHFVYDFFRCVLNDPRACGAFEHFTEECQRMFVSQKHN